MVDVVQTEILKKEVIMPGGDGTGPDGVGPMTGRRMGRCRDNDPSEGTAQNYGYGRGGGRRFGYGFGWRTGFGFGRRTGYNTASGTPGRYGETDVEREIEVLKDRLSHLEQMRDEKSR